MRVKDCSDTCWSVGLVMLLDVAIVARVWESALLPWANLLIKYPTWSGPEAGAVVPCQPARQQYLIY